MPNALALTLVLASLLALALVTPQAFAYGGIRWWAWIPPASALTVSVGVVAGLLRRGDRPRLLFYLAVAAGLCAGLALVGVLLRASA